MKIEDYDKRYPQIRLFSNQQNKGVVDNYFDCLLACKGKYIADCAGDDFWVDPEKLEKEVCVMEQHPQVTMVITNWRFYNELTQQTEPGHQKATNRFLPRRMKFASSDSCVMSPNSATIWRNITI